MAAALKFCSSLVDLECVPVPVFAFLGLPPLMTALCRACHRSLTFNSLGDKGVQVLAAGFKDCPSLELI